MSKQKSLFVCQACGYQTGRWLGRCPDCGGWNCLQEELLAPLLRGKRERSFLASCKEPMPLSMSSEAMDERVPTGLGELDRVLGGGVVKGSLVMIGGEPGIGKSTLMLQAGCLLSQSHGKLLYVAGEESFHQTSLRARRLKMASDNLLILPETNLEAILHQVERVMPSFLVIDSIQTLYSEDIASAPGSLSQVRHCASHLMLLAKEKGISTFLIGHVTKDGSLAGPRVLEHMVDTVLYFEGKGYHFLRFLRATKNRFGSTNEMGLFEMKEEGLQEVQEASSVFLASRPEGVSGSVVIASFEGTRPILLELQALTSPTPYGPPKRMATGLSLNRILMVMAVLEKRTSLRLRDQDVFINLVGGMRLEEPGMDLGLALAMASSLKELPLEPWTVVIGEVGLAGEIRPVQHVEKRLKEAKRLGFQKGIIPKANVKDSREKDMHIVEVSAIQEALREGFKG